ncbi:MAG: hypothetical protein CL783_07545 [Chloroflexi bacterium]|nr:hypothetical protein [Chloroflexota bacterium]|tara:strand:- start:615 stop:1202 length:588 start_codon:yes stop_codon:yes gene_type:complete
MLGLIFRKRLFHILGLVVVLIVSCNDASYELDNEFDPENLGLEPPTIFFHFPSGKVNSDGIAEIDLSVGDTDSIELYCYEVDSVGGAHLQIAFDSEVIMIDTVEHGEFFMNGNTAPIMITDQGQEEGFLNVFLFYEPSLTSVSASGTKAMARVIFTVKDEGSAPLVYTEQTVFRNPDNNTISLNTFGEGSVNASQ